MISGIYLTLIKTNFMNLKISLTSLLLAIYCFTASAQTIIIRASPSSAQEAVVSSVYSTSAGPNPVDFFGAAWTGGGTPGGWRTFFRFDFGTEATFSILGGLVIDSAFMKLWADTTSSWGYVGTPTFGSNNACVLYRVTTNWDSMMTWLSMPTYSTIHQGLLPQSTNLKQNYLHINITDLLVDMIASGQNYGFVIKSVQETSPYNSMIFHSSHSVDSNVRPVIVVYGHPSLKANVVANNDANIMVFPNPASSAITVNINKGIDEMLFLSLLDAQGRVVANTSNFDLSTNTAWNIDATKLPKGIYYVRVNSSLQNISKQVVVN